MTKKAILKDILRHFKRTTGEVRETATLGKSFLHIETDHIKAHLIGQFAMSKWPKRIYTYSVCHEFRQAHLSIFFKR